MGSGNVKLADLENLSVGTLLATMTSSCENCSTSFNIFKRKRVCNECRKNHCTDCLVREPSRSTSQRRCNKCRVLSSITLSRNDLLQLKVKDLRQYLEHRHIRTRDCKEKEDLVDLILMHFGSDAYHRQRVAHDREVLELRERNLQDFDASGQLSDDAAASSRLSNEQINNSDSSSNTATNHVTEGINGVDLPHNSSEDIEDSRNNSTMNNPWPQTRIHIKITDVVSEDHIDNLSVKELKEILTDSFVNYKGCCEKQELRERVLRLWKQQENVKEKVESGEPTDEEDVCKICMDAIIDCVLLECGHMVACTRCGKRLAECPICRQYVIRAVHIFKA